MKKLAFAAALVALVLIPAAAGSNTPNPTSVTIAGDVQHALGCGGDWDPTCAAAHLSYDANDDVWQGTWTLPAGSLQYKAALNDAWDENYGLHATRAARTSRWRSRPRRPSSSTTTTSPTGSPTTSAR